MSALGQKQTCALHQPMSALPPKADMCSAARYVRFVPIADILASQRDVRSYLDCVAKLFAALRSRNNRIRLNGALNQCCAFAFVFEFNIAHFGRQNSFATQSPRKRTLLASIECPLQCH